MFTWLRKEKREKKGRKENKGKTKEKPREKRKEKREKGRGSARQQGRRRERVHGCRELLGPPPTSVTPCKLPKPVFRKVFIFKLQNSFKN